MQIPGTIKLLQHDHTHTQAHIREIALEFDAGNECSKMTGSANNNKWINIFDARCACVFCGDL